MLCPDGLCGRPGPDDGRGGCRAAGPGRPEHQPAAGKADGEPQALPAAGRGADGAPLRGLAPGAAVRVPHHRGGRRGRGRGPADRGPERQTGRLPAESRGRCGRFSGKTDGRMKVKKGPVLDTGPFLRAWLLRICESFKTFLGSY